MSYRYRAYPEDAEGQCLAHCWDDRAIWNVAVEQFRMWRPGRRPSPSKAERARQLTEARQSIDWLAAGSSSVQQQALRIFDKAVSDFFAGTHDRPTFRGRGDKLGFTIRDVHVRKISRRQRKGSAGWHRTKQEIARLHAREADRAKDWIEQETTALVRHARVVVLEDLPVKEMAASAVGSVDAPTQGSAAKRGLNRELRRSRWGAFERHLTDKAAVSAAAVIKVPAAFTSQECGSCGHVSPDNRESQAVFRCVECGHEAHADSQAARTIRKRGMAHLGRILAWAAGLAVPACGDLQPHGGSRKHEPPIGRRTPDAA